MLNDNYLGYSPKLTVIFLYHFEAVMIYLLVSIAPNEKSAACLIVIMLVAFKTIALDGL